MNYNAHVLIIEQGKIEVAHLSMAILNEKAYLCVTVDKSRCKDSDLKLLLDLQTMLPIITLDYASNMAVSLTVYNLVDYARLLTETKHAMHCFLDLLGF